MLQKIKYYLFKIFLTQKKKLVLFSCLVFFGLFVVLQSTDAFVLNLANVQLDALDFIDNTILKWFVFLGLLAIESITLLMVSANLLDWSSSLPVGLDNGLVNAGWHFTSGLVNLSFILIFIVIALSYILKVDTFGMKKALPRLIGVAFLINFSLLFVKMFTDMGWIFQGSFRDVFFQGGGFATAAIESLRASSLNLIAVVVGVPMGYLVLALVPYANVAALMAIGTMVLAGGGGVLVGAISQTILVIAFNFILGLIFLVFAALFLIRIAAIWLLAIVAPLAFMAFILPDTKKYFNQWLKALLQWTLLGIIVFFLAGLGIKLFSMVAPGTGQEIIFPKDLGGWKFFDTFYKYIFLLIYLIVVLGASKKMVPAGTQAIWNFGEMAMGKGPKWAIGKAREWGGRTAEWGREKIPEGVRRWGERQAVQPSWGAGVPGPRGTAMRFFGTPFGRARRRFGATIGPTAVRLEKERIANIEKSIKTDEGLAGILKKYHDAKDDGTRIALLNTIIKGHHIDDAMDPDAFARRYRISRAEALGLVLTNQEVENRMEVARSWGADSTMKTAFPDIARAQLPPNLPPSLPPPGISLRQHQTQYIFDGIKPTDYEHMSKRVLGDDEFLEALIRRGKGGHIRQFIDRFGMDGSRAIEQRLVALAATVNLTPRQWLENVNPSLYRHTIGRGAGSDLFNIP